MVGLERSVLPLVGEQDFGLTSTAAILAFVRRLRRREGLTNLVPAASPSGSAESGCS